MKVGEIQRNYDRVAADYDEHDALEREVGERLLDRISFARQPVHAAVDLGCGTGRAAVELQRRIDSAYIAAVDVSPAMLSQARLRPTGGPSIGIVQADLSQIPLAARAFDLVFSNLALQWASDFQGALNEIRRILKPGGMLLFSVPGPRSFGNLRLQPKPGARAEMPIYMPDLQELGDLLVTAGFSEPVMDSELIALHYPSPEAMTRELAVTGGAGFMDVVPVPAAGSVTALEIEVVYGTAFGPGEGQPVRTREGEVATFSVERLRRGKPSSS